MLTKIFLKMEDFLSYCQSKGLSQKTILSYDQTLKLFAKYLEVEHGEFAYYWTNNDYDVPLYNGLEVRTLK